MSVQELPEEQLIRFEDVTPARDIVAFFAGSLKPLVNHLNLPVYLGYDDLDEILFTFLTLPSGKTVTLGQYRGSPQLGVDLYVDPSIQDVPAVIYESCQQLEISHSEVTWLHADVQKQVDRLYAENGDFPGGRAGVLLIEPWPKSSEHKPLKCFLHSLRIYDQQVLSPANIFEDHSEVSQFYYRLLRMASTSSGVSNENNVISMNDYIAAVEPAQPNKPLK